MKKTQFRKDPEAIKAIKNYLETPGNSQAKLAMTLGYQTTGAISMWLSRKKVPIYQRERLLRICRGDENQ